MSRKLKDCQKTLVQLRAMATRRNISGRSKMNKAELCKVLGIGTGSGKSPKKVSVKARKPSRKSPKKVSVKARKTSRKSPKRKVAVKARKTSRKVAVRAKVKVGSRKSPKRNSGKGTSKVASNAPSIAEIKEGVMKQQGWYGKDAVKATKKDAEHLTNQIALDRGMSFSAADNFKDEHSSSVLAQLKKMKL